MGINLKIDQSIYNLLSLCNGYLRWDEILEELCRGYDMSKEEVKNFFEPKISMFTDEGLIWWREKRMAMWDTKPPGTVCWNLTSQCNMYCKHCAVDSGDDKINEFSYEESISLLTEFFEFGVEDVLFSGGEPLMHPNFMGIVERTHELGISVHVSTNGTLVDSEVAKKLADLDASVQVSMDGVTPRVHEMLRQTPGCWERAVNGIKNLVRANVPVTIGSTVNKGNLNEILLLYKMAKDLNVQDFRIIPFIPFGRGREIKDMEVSPANMEKITTYLHEQRQEVQGKKLGVVPMEFEWTLEPPIITPFDENSRLGCEGAIESCTITSTGEVLPCHFFTGVRTENVRDYSFEYIWKNSWFLNYFRSLNVSDIQGVCKECDWFSYCKGGCLAANFAHRKFLQSNCHCWLVEKEQKC